MAARRRKPRRFVGLLVLLGCFAVLGSTFTAGYLVGRHGTRLSVVTGLVKPRPPAETPARATPGPTKPTELPMPRLTFYQELTAPLTSPPRIPAATPPKPAKPEIGTPRVAEPSRPAETARPAVAAMTEVRPAPAADGRFTVQVGAYAARSQADALRERLSAQGFAADVSEAETNAGTRYRVRVGNFATRDEARAEADRLASSAKLSGVLVRLPGASH